MAEAVQQRIMPKRYTSKTIARIELVLKLVKQRKYVVTSEVRERLGWPQHLTYYVLKTMRDMGLVREEVLGKKAYWYTGEIDVKIEVMEIVRKTLCKLAKGSEGNVICVKSRDVQKHLPPKYRGYHIPQLIETILAKYHADYDELKKKKKTVIFCIKKYDLVKICGQ